LHDRLNDLRDPVVLRPNDKSIKDRMGQLVKEAAQDIKECGNACDVWMKKHPLAKVLVGVSWERELASFFEKFSSRRMAFDFALQIRTATANDAMQLVLEKMQKT
jgi:hypothetical protein